MRILLLVCSIVAFLVGVLVELIAKSAIQEQLAGLALVCSAVLFSGSAIVGKLDEIADLLD